MTKRRLITGKEFNLDTNILIDDPYAMFGFGKHDVTIAIQVLEELDRFKSGQDLKGDSAREVTRQIDKLFSPKIYTTGVSLGKGKGMLRIYLLKQMNLQVKKALKDDTKDHRIISVALNRKNMQKQDKEVIFVSNDVNLRLKAGSFGLNVEGRKATRVEDIDHLYTGKTIVETTKEVVNIDLLHKNKSHSSKGLVVYLKRELLPNEYFILNIDNKSAIVRHFHDKLLLVQESTIYGKVKARNAEQKIAFNAVCDDNIFLITIIGKAGTGKTLVALGAALKKITNYDQILIARPIVALSNKDLGYLPGDVKDKVMPYMQPLFDNIKVLKRDNGDTAKTSLKIDKYFDSEKIIIEPLAFIRGRSFNKTLLIIDEAQQLTPKEVKTIVTRMGEGSKVVFTGDIHQIDAPYLDSHSNGLTYLVDRTKGFENSAHIQLEKSERSSLAEWAADNL